MPQTDETILILGASGWIGHHFAQQVCTGMPRARVVGTYFSEPARSIPCRSLFFDYSDESSLPSILQDVKPSVVVNLLGGEENLLLRTHQELTRKLKELSAYYMFMSSSTVFDCSTWHYLRTNQKQTG